MKSKFLTIAILILASMALYSQNVESNIKDIRAIFTETNNNIKNYSQDKKSVDGYNLVCYSENGIMKRIDATFNGKPTEHFYYNNNAFIFMYNDGKEVNRYYFSNERMIRWLDKDKKEVASNNPNYKSTEKNLVNLATKFMGTPRGNVLKTNANDNSFEAFFKGFQSIISQKDISKYNQISTDWYVFRSYTNDSDGTIYQERKEGINEIFGLNDFLQKYKLKKSDIQYFDFQDYAGYNSFSFDEYTDKEEANKIKGFLSKYGKGKLIQVLIANKMKKKDYGYPFYELLFVSLNGNYYFAGGGWYM